MFARSELPASKTESSLASNSPALAGSPSLLHSTMQSFSSLFMLYTSTQRSLSSQFGHDLRRRTGYLLSLSLLQSRTRGSRPLRHSVLPTRIGHMPATPSFAFQTAPAVQVASLVKRDHHSAQQLLLFTVVTVVVTGTLCFFAVSLSFSLFAPVLGSGPVVYLQALFRVKDGLRRRPTHSLHTAFTAAPHTAHLASRARSCKFTLHSAIARRIGDVASKRLEHPPLASVCVFS